MSTDRPTRWTELVGVERPLQQAAMSRVATQELVAAVCNAGAQGLVPIGRSGPEAALAACDAVEALTDRPYGVGFVMPFFDAATYEALVERVAVTEFAFGWPDPKLVAGSRPGSGLTGWLIGTVEEAKAAVDAGCAYVIAQGIEAGGHVRDRVPLVELVPAVAAAVEVPVVAAGGIGTAADVDRAFELGADAVRVGTRFLGAAETNVHPRYLELLLAAGADDTTWTFDYQVGWPGPEVAIRLLTSAHAAANETELDPVGALGERQIERFSTTPPVRETTGLIEAMALYAGTSVGALSRVTDAAAIIDELLDGLAR
jgi:NAD(P)H-dependent flavin oxidoreductase YrpB (nitropropane dioxygenase family)